jgi:hypothetical protein
MISWFTTCLIEFDYSIPLPKTRQVQHFLIKKAARPWQTEPLVKIRSGAQANQNGVRNFGKGPGT